MRKLFASILLTVLVYGCTSDRHERKINSTSDRAIDYFKKARDLAADAEYVRAIAFYDSALAHDPEFSMAYSMQAIIHKLNRRDEPSKVCLENAIKTADSLSFYDMTYIQMAEGKDGFTNGAEKIYLRDSLDFYHEFQLGWAYLVYARDFEKALYVLDRILISHPQHPPTHNLIAYVYMGLGHFDRARFHLEKYIELLPDRPNPYDSMADFLLQQGDTVGALENYQIAFQKDSLFDMAMVKFQRLSSK